MRHNAHTPHDGPAGRRKHPSGGAVPRASLRFPSNTWPNIQRADRGSGTRTGDTWRIGCHPFTFSGVSPGHHAGTGTGTGAIVCAMSPTRRLTRHELRVSAADDRRFQRVRDQHHLTNAEAWRMIVKAGLALLLTDKPPTHRFDPVPAGAREIPCLACGARFPVVHGGINADDLLVGVPVDQAQCPQADDQATAGDL